MHSHSVTQFRTQGMQGTEGKQGKLCRQTRQTSSHMPYNALQCLTMPYNALQCLTQKKHEYFEVLTPGPSPSALRSPEIQHDSTS